MGILFYIGSHCFTIRRNFDYRLDRSYNFGSRYWKWADYEKVTSDDKYCRSCGAIFVLEAKCSNHPKRTANYCCVVCSKPLCDKCAILIKGSHRCFDHHSIEIREDWTKAHVATTFVEAQLIEKIFRDNNITSKCLSNVMGSNYGAIKLWQLTPVIPFMVARWLGGGEIKIFVPAADYERSSKLLEERLSQHNEK